MKLDIFAMTHKKLDFTLPEHYHFLHVGRACGEDLGYPGDNTGENISEKNRYYSELTGLYWLWKNFKDADHIGICHYRRYFINEKGNLLSKAEFDEIFKEYDVVIAKSLEVEKTYREIFAESHNIKDLEATEDVIKELFPEYHGTFLDVMDNNRVYVGNMMVMSITHLQQYASWLFSIFDKVEKRINVEDYDSYHKRVFGFLSEELLFVWIKKNNLKYYECNVGISQEKMETIELEKELSALLFKKAFHEANTLVKTILKDRPDLILQHSDIYDRLRSMISISAICEAEEVAEELESVSMAHLLNENSIDALINLIVEEKHLIAALLSGQDYSVTESKYDISCIGINSLVMEFGLSLQDYVSLLNKIAMYNFKKGKFEKVIPFFEIAYSTDENNRQTLENLVFVMNSIGETELANEYQNRLV